MTDTISETGSITIRPMTGDDAQALVTFAQAMPLNDLLFLQRDIRHPKVVAAWVRQTEQNAVRSFVAVNAQQQIFGCAAVIRDPLSWSPHVAEVRLVVSPEARGLGLGRKLAQEALAQTVKDETEKLFIRLVPDQTAAIALFEEMGFRPEAMLRDHVLDADGNKHDIAILSLDVVRHSSQMRAFGMAQ